MSKPIHLSALSLTLSAAILFALGGCRSRQAPQLASVKPVLGPDEPGTAMPPEFDRKMPIFPGATVDHVRRPRGAMREIELSTGAPLETLIRFYTEGLKQGGFDITSTLTLAARKTWSCDFHREGQQASIKLYPSDRDKSLTTIDLIYEIPKPSNERLALPEEQFDVVGPGELAQKTQDSGERRN